MGGSGAVPVVPHAMDPPTAMKRATAPLVAGGLRLWSTIAYETPIRPRPMTKNTPP
jgi:hypothetical protein